MTGPVLGDVLRLSDDLFLKGHGVEALEGRPLAGIGDLSRAVYELVNASLGGAPRIHPTAYVSPLANVAEDVVVGPGARIHEYSTVRGRTVLSAGVHVGYGCEISRSLIGENSILSHRATVGCCVIGRDCYFSADLLTAACLMSNPDMLHPVKPVHLALPDGSRATTGEAKWSALIGDGVRAGSRVTVGPGAVIGSRAVIGANVTVATSWVPPDSRIAARIPDCEITSHI